MKTITTNAFSVALPNGFQVLEQTKIGLRAENSHKNCKIQHPHLEVRLFKLEDLQSDSYKGSTLQKKWEDWCLSRHYKSELLSFEETPFKGFKTYIVHAHTDAPWNNIHFKLQYFQVAVFLDDTFFLEFKTVHEKIASNRLDDWVGETFKSLSVLGDVDARKQAYAQHLIDNQKEYKNTLEAQETNEQKAAERKKNSFLKVQIPADGQEVFKVGEFYFDFVSEETGISIGKMSRDLQLNIKGKTKNTKKAKNAKILDDYPGDGTVSFTIPAIGIHHNGEVKGQFYFEDGKTNAPLFLNARSEGFEYGLAFNGSVTFTSGWALLKGEMTKSYHNKAYSIFVAKKMDVSGLNWSHYRFSSMEESASAKTEEVRWLSLRNPSFLKLPEALFGFKNLQELTIFNKDANYSNTKLPLHEIQEAIGKLSQLKRLSISGAALEHLPESIGQLTELEQLNISNCQLNTIPQSIFELPKLKYLWLSSNKLKRVPENIDLPALQNISLNNNKLTSLPEALAKQPQLKQIKLNNNPLKILPDAFNIIKEIDLAIEDKLCLLDFGYKGADGKGLVPWKDNVFWAQNDANLLSEIQMVLKEKKLEEHATGLQSIVKKAIGFSHEAAEDYSKVGNHRFGGMPDLPENMPYPRFGKNWREGKEDYVYEFIGQINCEAIAHLQDYLPRTGSLFFFLETMHHIYARDNNPGKVIYVKNNKALASGKRFQFTEDDYFEMFDQAYAPYKVKPDKINSAPSFYASYVNKHHFLGEAKKLMDNEQLLDSLYDSFERPINDKNNFQYAVNAYGFTQHEAPELQASLSKKGNPEDWVILLTVTSAGDMQWGDAGDLFFVIHKSDLAKQDFTNVFVTLESS